VSARRLYAMDGGARRGGSSLYNLESAAGADRSRGETFAAAFDFGRSVEAIGACSSAHRSKRTAAETESAVSGTRASTSAAVADWDVPGTVAASATLPLNAALEHVRASRSVPLMADGHGDMAAIMPSPRTRAARNDTAGLSRRPHGPTDLSDDDIEAELELLPSSLSAARARSAPNPVPQVPPGAQPGDDPARDPGPPAPDPHGIFDRMGRSMRYANTFNLGTVDLDSHLRKVERAVIAEDKAVEARTVSSPASNRRPDEMDELELVSELAALAEEAGLPRVHAALSTAHASPQVNSIAKPVIGNNGTLIKPEPGPRNSVLAPARREESRESEVEEHVTTDVPAEPPAGEAPAMVSARSGLSAAQAAAATLLAALHGLPPDAEAARTGAGGWGSFADAFVPDLAMPAVFEAAGLVSEELPSIEPEPIVRALSTHERVILAKIPDKAIVLKGFDGEGSATTFRLSDVSSSTSATEGIDALRVRLNYTPGAQGSRLILAYPM
jgi:hypothetical protein